MVTKGKAAVLVAPEKIEIKEFTLPPIGASAAENYMPDVMTRKELTIKGVLGRTSQELKHALRLLESGKYPFEKQCTHRYSIEETERAIRTVGRQGDPGAIHVAVVNS